MERWDKEEEHTCFFGLLHTPSLTSKLLTHHASTCRHVLGLQYLSRVKVLIINAEGKQCMRVCYLSKMYDHKFRMNSLVPHKKCCAKLLLLRTQGKAMA